MVALVLCGCSEQPENHAEILIEETVLQEDQISGLTATDVSVAPQMPAVQPTEAPSNMEPERIDTSALASYGNSFAASLGFSIDYSVRDGYFPPDTVGFFSMNAAYSNVVGNVMVLYNNIIARDGSIDGYRCCVTASDNGDGICTTTVYYG